MSFKIILELIFIIKIYSQKNSKLNLALLIKMMKEEIKLKLLIKILYNKRNAEKRYVIIKAFTQWEYNVQNILLWNLVLTIFIANLW